MMSKIKHYYQCDMYSTIGKQLQKYWDCIIRAASRADDYARKYGASSYEAPVQYFEGGVDYLIFDHTPDLKVWRKKITDAEGTDLYEPNCMYRSDVLVMPDDRFHPSDTWDKTYSKEHLAWKDAKQLKTFDQWAAIAKLKRTDDREADMKALDQLMSRYTFVTFLHFYGDEPATVPDASPSGSRFPQGRAAGRTAAARARAAASGKNAPDCPQWLRKAIRAEKDRQALPVVEIYPLMAMLDMRPSTTGRSVTLNVTPQFFLYGETFFIGTEYPCHAEGLHPTTEGNFICNMNAAKRQRNN